MNKVLFPWSKQFGGVEAWASQLAAVTNQSLLSLASSASAKGRKSPTRGRRRLCDDDVGSKTFRIASASRAEAAVMEIMALNPDQKATEEFFRPARGARGPRWASADADQLELPHIKSSALKGLTIALTEHSNTAFAANFVEEVMPWMLRVLDEAYAVVGDDLPLLTTVAPDAAAGSNLASRGTANRILLSQRQVATLMIMGFFSLFPFRFNNRWPVRGFADNSTQSNPLYRELQMPSFNFVQLMVNTTRASAAKLRCILQYFTVMQRDWDAIVEEDLSIEILRHAKFVSLSEDTGAPLLLDTSSSSSSSKTKSSSSSTTSNALPLSPIDYRRNFPLEQCDGCIQSDFANEWIGGGVLRFGAVQEEILFAVSTELLVSLLLCEKMAAHEVVVLSGFRQFSRSSGYGDSFRFEEELDVSKAAPVTTIQRPPPTLNARAVACAPTPSSTKKKAAAVAALPAAPQPIKMRDVLVVAFDALNFSGSDPKLQFMPRLINRELCKAMAAVEAPSLSSLLMEKEGLVSSATESTRKALGGGEGGSADVVDGAPAILRPFATGNWGCGVFAGHHALKFMLQWVAASSAGRPFVYSAFGPDSVMAEVQTLVDHFSPIHARVQIDAVCSALLRYHPHAYTVPLGQFLIRELSDKAEL